MKRLVGPFPSLKISLELPVTGLERLAASSQLAPDAVRIVAGEGAWGGPARALHEQPPSTGLFLLLPLNTLASAASVTTGTGEVPAVGQRVSEEGKCLWWVRLSHRCASSSAGPPRNALVAPWKQQHSLTASSRSRVNSGLTYLSLNVTANATQVVEKNRKITSQNVCLLLVFSSCY